MSKLRVRGTLYMLVLFTAVAVFPTVVKGLTSKNDSRKAGAGEFRNTGVLIADGGDPVPDPLPLPRPWQTA